jgi:mono/diheme cytochrome c family protein
VKPLPIRTCFLFVVSLTALCATGCQPDLPPGKPVSALTPDEAAGHEVFERQCARCHTAYSPQATHGPSMYGVFRRPDLPSGMKATDDRVSSVILHGRGMMPAFSNKITDDDLQLLLKYLHTL